MPLADLQIALGSMVSAAASANPVIVMNAFDQLQLSQLEIDWLNSLNHERGFNVTCAIQRWWRETRLRSMARLTIAALGKELADAMIHQYLQANRCASLFFLPETLGFLQFVETHSQHIHHSTISQFEAALIQAREAAASGLPTEKMTVTKVEFAASPEALIAALLLGHSLPEPTSERFPVLISGALPQFWCVATMDEAFINFELNEQDDALTPDS